MLVPVNTSLPHKGEDTKPNLTILAASRRDFPPKFCLGRSQASNWSQDLLRDTTATLLPNDEGHKSTAIQTMHTLKHPVNQADLWSGKPAGIMSILWIHNVLKLPLCEASPWFVWEPSNAESTAASCCLSRISIIFGWAPLCSVILTAVSMATLLFFVNISSQCLCLGGRTTMYSNHKTSMY